MNEKDYNNKVLKFPKISRNTIATPKGTKNAATKNPNTHYLSLSSLTPIFNTQLPHSLFSTPIYCPSNPCLSLSLFSPPPDFVPLNQILTEALTFSPLPLDPLKSPLSLTPDGTPYPFPHFPLCFSFSPWRHRDQKN
jgi:hypothetical protein